MKGHEGFRSLNRGRSIPFLILAATLILGACREKANLELYTVGVVIYNPELERVFDGFKARMAELEYAEGKNVVYLFDGTVNPDIKSIDAEIKHLMDRKVDLFLTVGTLPARRAKEAVAGTDIPVIFGPVLDPIAEGLVKNLRRPGGNATGVQTGDAIGKSLEWLTVLVPKVKRIYIPYNPEDKIAQASFKPLREAAGLLGVELVPDEIGTPDELMAAVETMPADVGGVFILPSPSLASQYNAFCTAVALQRGLPVSGAQADESLHAYSSDMFHVGEQMARLAVQVLRGANPADTPVETAENELRVNMKAAETIGLQIPAEVLLQADIIIR